MTNPNKITTVQRHVRMLGEQLFTRPEAAEALGVSVDRLRAAHRRGVGPSRELRFGKSYAWLYTLDDITRLEQYFAEEAPRPGAPRQYTPEQVRDRTNLHSLRSYYRQRAERVTDPEVKAHALARLQQIEDELKTMQRVSKGGSADTP